MKYVTNKNVILNGKVVPAGKSIELDEKTDSAKALLKSGHIVSEADAKKAKDETK